LRNPTKLSFVGGENGKVVIDVAALKEFIRTTTIGITYTIAIMPNKTVKNELRTTDVPGL
jgi:hypothetical protein